MVHKGLEKYSLSKYSFNSIILPLVTKCYIFKLFFYCYKDFLVSR